MPIAPSIRPPESIGLLPYLPLSLASHGRTVQALGLLDTAATVNVMPWSIGLQLGFDWDQQSTQLQLTGNLSGFESRAVLTEATVGGFPPVRLAFAWTTATSVPLIFGADQFLPGI